MDQSRLIYRVNPNSTSDNDGEKSSASNNSNIPEQAREDGKYEIQETDNYEALGYSFSTIKKWTILSVIFIVQVSMNFNTSVYANAVTQLSEHFNVSEQAARVPELTFLVLYAFGSELWAPWSEEYGRWIILQMSLFLVNIWQIPCALAPNYGTLVVCRALGGLSSAGGSVTLGMVADMWEPNDQQYATAYVVLSSVGGSVVGGLVGGFIETFLSWHWNFWIQLIFGGAVQAIHFFVVPETRSTIMLKREAKRRRKAGEENVYGPGELSNKSLNTKEIFAIWTRPFIMFAREPIVLCLSLLSGFSDALIFTFLDSYTLVYAQWNFTVIDTSLALIPLIIGYLLAYLSFIPVIYSQQKLIHRDPDAFVPEERLWWLLFMAPLETIGLFGFSWTSLGPPRVHWIAPMIFSTLVGAANYSIYMATIDYMIASYGPYSASATGGNALARDFLAGLASIYSTPFYEYFKTYTLEYPSTILACMAFAVTTPIYVFYWKGEVIREKSKFAQTLASERKARGGHRALELDEKYREQRIETV
ncbi:hypothetical protein PACTADRAFT_3993 [Pachysolen tannophilus NRRL Y-2460]|uniref:Major facilitator superfamily (MFS) profile domain-containing protein n=1 Tax=Pachysolen tannophilus NRRL Y-2460 TaxID=669874 RepID=A0A1E4TQK9_PACTA|nr:hypothetical protein PACTADRAFT_3993 [Pachysolen tannophilus NRRL Y-2460]